jgi:hypothetical protein
MTLQKLEPHPEWNFKNRVESATFPDEMRFF